MRVFMEKNIMFPFCRDVMKLIISYVPRVRCVTTVLTQRVGSVAALNSELVIVSCCQYSGLSTGKEVLNIYKFPNEYEPRLLASMPGVTMQSCLVTCEAPWYGQSKFKGNEVLLALVQCASNVIIISVTMTNSTEPGLHILK